MIIPVDLGLAFTGTPSGNTIPGWDKPQPYTPKLDDGYIPPAWMGDAILPETSTQSSSARAIFLCSDRRDAARLPALSS